MHKEEGKKKQKERTSDFIQEVCAMIPPTTAVSRLSLSRSEVADVNCSVQTTMVRLELVNVMMHCSLHSHLLSHPESRTDSSPPNVTTTTLSAEC
jgi:hypothetical protein